MAESRYQFDFPTSDHQEVIFDFVAKPGDDDRHGFVDAVAGSGKSYSLECCAMLLDGERGHSFAFNTHIAKELGFKLKERGADMSSSTIHAAGRACVADHHDYAEHSLRRNWVNGRKYGDIVKAVFGEIRDDGKIGKFSVGARAVAAIDDEYPLGDVRRLVDLIRGNLLDPRDDEGIYEIVSRHAMVFHPAVYEILPRLAREVVMRGLFITDQIDFTDMIWLPTVKRMRPRTHQWVFVDEAQDLNPAQFALVRKCVRKDGRMLFVGDPCQPPGTMVSVPGGKRRVSIESLKVGDKVVSCDVSTSAFIQKGKKVTGISEKPFDGKLVAVESRYGHRSRYTPNHRCVASFSWLRKHYGVYLMCRGDRFRVGVAKMDYTHASGPVARAKAEKADAVWILRTFESSDDARMWEEAISGRFGIPQLMFEPCSLSKVMDRERLDTAWEFVGDLFQRALRCLEYFGRDVRFPLFDLKNGNETFSGGRNRTGQMTLKRPMIVRACNLMDGVQMLRYDGKGHYTKRQWIPVSVSRERYVGSVYSIDVEKYELYVADGLLTHNCQAIYGFAGADCDSVKNIIEAMDATMLPLSVCYRCPISHVKLAQKIVPKIQWAEGAKEGEVLDITEEKLHELVKEGDLVLCRTNAPLLKTCYQLIAEGVPAKVRGRKIGEGLVKIVKDIRKKVGDFDRFIEALEGWTEDQVWKIERQKGDNDGAKAIIYDKTACLRVVYGHSGSNSYDELMRSIGDLFSDNREAVMLSTVHKAKGLEADRVFILKPELMPHPMAKQAWELEQEMNLLYVALTRAKETLVFVHETGYLPHPNKDEDVDEEDGDLEDAPAVFPMGDVDPDTTVKFKSSDKGRGR